MNKLFYLLTVNPDTWKYDKWLTVGVFDSEEEAGRQGCKFKDSASPYAGYRITQVTLNPAYEEWGCEEEEERE